jgi:carboxyl-terminal processing protease
VETTAWVRGVGSNPPADAKTAIDFDQFWSLWNLLKEKFYLQPLDEQKMLYGAMSGLAASTGDPYTVFFEPSVADEFSKSLEGKFEGIGAEIGIRDNQLQIIAPLPETPAAKAGLLPGDAILSIDATSTEGMSVEEAIYLIRGPKGTTVSLTIGRMVVKKDAKGKETKEPTTKVYPIVRDTIVVKSDTSEFLPDGIVLIQINHFNSDTTDEFSKAVDAAVAKDVKGVILDLRSNPGGYLDRSTAVAGEWLGSDVVVIERRQGKTVDEYHGTGSARLKGIPTVVLVDEGSASAAEIVAGALQDTKAATIVGEKTFGKGSVQDYTELENGTAVKITIAEWLTPKGRSINNVGIEPDITVKRTIEDINAQRDPQRDKAIELLTGKTPTPKAGTQ